MSSEQENSEGSGGAGDRAFARWLRWWERISWSRKIGPLLGALIYSGILLKASRFGAAHASVLLVLLSLTYAGPALSGALHFIAPLGLVALLYDSMALYKDRLRGTVHIVEPYRFDLDWFGVRGADGLMLTPNEYWQLNISPFLDAYTGFFYISFLGLFIGTAAYLRFLHPRASRRPESRLPAWAFLWTNLLGYITYFVYPAAPPWYVARYGLGPLHAQVLPSAAGGARFDALVGVRLFESFYSRSQDVFGSIPSLHVAYPMILVYFAFRLGVARTWALIFYGSMCFAAIYLDHHYVLDLLLGSLYALLVCTTLSWVSQKSLRRRTEVFAVGEWRGAKQRLPSDREAA